MRANKENGIKYTMVYSDNADIEINVAMTADVNKMFKDKYKDRVSIKGIELVIDCRVSSLGLTSRWVIDATLQVDSRLRGNDRSWNS